MRLIITKLRRTPFAFSFQYLSWYGWFVAAICTASFIDRPHAGIAIFGGLMLLGSCVTLLFGVSIAGDVVRYGFRWRRKVVPAADIEAVFAGRIKGFGPRGSDAKGLVLYLAGGREVRINESQSCTRRRLAAWARMLREVNENIVVRTDRDDAARGHDKSGRTNP